MLRALSPPERQVLLAHERANARSLHYLFTTAARLAAAANPLYARSPPPWATPWSGAPISAPPRPKLLLLSAAVLLVAVSGLSALEAARDLHVVPGMPPGGAGSLAGGRPGCWSFRGRD